METSEDIARPTSPPITQTSGHFEYREMEDNLTVNEASPLIDSRTGRRWNWWERPSEATPKIQYVILNDRSKRTSSISHTGSAVTALPMNGGTYNILLNTTSKKIASVAGALSLLSYIATAVVSANSAMEYLQAVWEKLPIYYAVVIVLFLFMALNLLGITESAVVATFLFVVHCLTLMVLIIASCVKMGEIGVGQLKENWNQPHVLPAGTVAHLPTNAAMLIYLGYGASMLGITGFETSANFVEEQAPGVFPKTLRNMWIAVAFFNPVISFLSFGILDMQTIQSDPSSLLANMANAAAGKWLKLWVSVDAVLVLSGAVLTAYVGVTGLARRLALDRILPQFLLSENKLRKTPHWIIIGFFILCSALYLVIAHTKNPREEGVAAVNTLSGVYTAAFLLVMSMFALGNMMLKYKRSQLPREIYTPWPIVIIAYIGVLAAFVSDLLGNPSVLLPFLIYFVATMLVFIIMFLRISLLKILLFFSARLFSKNAKIKEAIARKIQETNSIKVIFFTKDADVAVLNKAILYIRDNEQTNWVLMVHVCRDEKDAPKNFEENCLILDKAYPKFRVDPVVVRGDFGPELIEELSGKLQVPKNFMFITTPSERFSHKVSDFGGVRLVTN